MIKLFKKIFIYPFLYLFISLFIIFEVFIWKQINIYIYEPLSALKIMQTFKIYLLLEENRYILLLIFIIPFLLEESLSFYSIFLIGSGLILSGTFLYVGKLILMVPVVIIFTFAKDKLLTFPIINFGYKIVSFLQNNRFYLSIKLKFSNFKERLFSEIIFFKKEYLTTEDGDLKSFIKLIYRVLRNKIKK